MKNEFKLEVTIKNKLYNKDDFYIVRAIVNKVLEGNANNIQKEITMHLNTKLVATKTKMIVAGDMKLNNTYGYYLKVNEWEEKEATSVGELKSFLKIKGVGEKLIKELITEFGLNTINAILSRNPKAIAIVKNDTKFEKLYNHVNIHRAFNKLSMVLQSIGCIHLSNNLYTKYGETALDILKKQPYKLYEDIKIQDLLRLKETFNYDEDSYNKALITFGLRNGLREGHICVTLDYLKDFFNVNHIFNIDYFSKAMWELKENGVVVEVNNIYYLKEMYELENMVFTKLKKIVEKNEDITVNNYTNQITKLNGTLDKKQIDAINMMLNNNISILTGGPGTGKTFTVNAFLKTLESIHKGVTIKLLAPTGKASNRLTELTGREASTIHKALLLKGNDDDEINTIIEDDYLVVDESSMIDMFLFCKLILRVSDNTKIVFVGDINQLKGIGAGDMLDDMIDSYVIPVTKLNKIFRQAETSKIVSNAHKIISNMDNGTNLELETDENFVIWDINTTTKQKHVGQMIKRIVDVKGYSLRDICILTATNREAGELNRYIQGLFNKSTIEFKIDDLNVFKLNDRVIHIKNNYDLNVMNGEVGYISSIGGGLITVEYGEKIVEYDIDTIEELRLAYAITVHKSQGSEFPVVVNTVNKIDECILTSNLLYTAITRAKEMVVLIGEKEHIQSLTNKVALHKKSTLANRLQAI